MNEKNVCANGISDCGNSPHYTERTGFRWLPELYSAAGLYTFMGRRQSAVNIGYSYYDNDNVASSWWVCEQCAAAIIPHVIDELPV